MLRKNSHSHVVKESNVGDAELKGNSILVDYFYFFNFIKVRCIFGTVFRILYCLYGELYILRR
mgnify:CR=1 FL=1